MVYLDPSELASTSRLPPIPGARPRPGLEADTGADMLITPLTLPCTNARMLDLHLAAGGILVQRKSGHDLISSLGDRMMDSIARMSMFDIHPCQRRLLHTGVYAEKAGVTWIDGRKCQFQGRTIEYATLVEATDKWTERGGSTTHLLKDKLIPDWVAKREAALAVYRTQSEKWIVSNKKLTPLNDKTGLQTVKEITDGRGWLIRAFKGFGTATVNKVWEACGGDVTVALEMLTSPDYQPLPQAITPRMVASVREQMHLDPEQWVVAKIPF